MSNKAIDKSTIGGRLIFEALDDQVLYSADVLGGLDSSTFLDRDAGAQHTNLLISQAKNEIDKKRDTYKAQEDELYAAHEVVFVDTDTENYQQLLNDLTSDRVDGRHFDIYILDNNIDGVQQISDVLATYDSLNAVHLISHGFEGAINVGSTQLDLNALISNEVEISMWADAFDLSGDLLIYGCDLASSAEGQRFVDELAKYTGTDVAASVDLTGHSVLGGDWDLEYLKGEVESDIAFSSELKQRWVGILAPDFTPVGGETLVNGTTTNSQETTPFGGGNVAVNASGNYVVAWEDTRSGNCLLYTSPSPRDKRQSRMPSSA